jgi:hypothetical protein
LGVGSNVPGDDLPDKFGRSDHAAFLIDTRMDREAFGQLFHGFFTIYPVDKFYTAPDFFVQGGLDDQRVVISGRGRKFAVAFGDR